MARDLTDNLDTAVAAPAQSPINLYIVFLDDYTLYLTGYPTDINFFSWNSTLDEISSSPQTYNALAISHEDIRTSADTKIDQVTVKLDNINRLMGSYIATYEFRGRRMIILRVYKDYLTNYQDCVVLFDGLMDNPIISETAMQVTLKPRIGTLSLYTPRRLYDVACNWRFGSTECGYNRVASGVSGVMITSGTTTWLGTIAYVSPSGIYQTDDYWKYGSIELVNTGATAGEKRQVTASSGVKIFLDYALSSGVDTGTKLLLHCDGVDGSTTFTDETQKVVTVEDSYDPFTKLLLHCDGTSGTTTFTDEVGNAVSNTEKFDSYTKLLIHFDGTSGTNTYTAETGQVVTFVNAACLDDHDKKFGTTSLYCDGAGGWGGGYVTVPESTNFDFGTEAFTIDFWAYKTASDDKLLFNLSADPPEAGQIYLNLWPAGTRAVFLFLKMNGIILLW
jgi:hypothetical protein